MSDSDHPSNGINPTYTVMSKGVKNIAYYLDGLQQKNRYILSECITLLESAVPEKRNLALQILEQLPKPSSTSIRVGITGSPGVGKSTLIGSLGMYVIGQGKKPAILVIDPSSQINMGSILGDKTRMQTLANQQEAYIRPTPSGKILGGTSEYTREVISLCEAAGYDMIIVETVGVGQSEIEVDHITDINLLLLQPGAGDDIQGIKRGVVENADIFIINKADGPQEKLAQKTKISYQAAIGLFHHSVPQWKTPVILSSAINNQGIDMIYKAIIDYFTILQETGILEKNRIEQELRWFETQSVAMIKKIIFENIHIREMFYSLVQDIQKQKTSTSIALNKLALLLHSKLDDK